MTITIKTVTAKNFMSIGAVTQAVNFDTKNLTLILGENLDLGGGDAGSRNGVGKSALLNALSYALYGAAVSNIKKENLINRTNGKNMVVTVEFEKDNTLYRIERGRRPNITRFWVGDTEQELANDAQGDSRETQRTIDHILGMSHSMFQHIVALNTYTDPFLNMKVSEQRNIIEELLGITLLSEKADLLKESIRNSKESITQEEYRIKAVTDANVRIEEQIANLKRRQLAWIAKNSEDRRRLQLELDKLMGIDIESEIENHKLYTRYLQHTKDVSLLAATLQKERTLKDKEEQSLLKLEKEIELLKEHKCHSCGQDIHDETHERLLLDKNTAKKNTKASIKMHKDAIAEYEQAIKELGDFEQPPKTFYKNESEAVQHKNTVANITQQLATLDESVDPYLEQITEMVETAVEKIDYSTINDLTVLREHQEFLLKLLTNKDSFIRKRIIDQNLSYLNARLSQYLDRIGLPHTVVFQSDLSVDITELGRPMDFHNLSRGESTRLILSLSWAFRDVWEASCQPINLLFVDELIDNGIDAAGSDCILKVLKDSARNNNKSVWLVSHKDDFTSRVDNIFKVVKSNGFTEFVSEEDN